MLDMLTNTSSKHQICLASFDFGFVRLINLFQIEASVHRHSFHMHIRTWSVILSLIRFIKFILKVEPFRLENTKDLKVFFKLKYIIRNMDSQDNAKKITRVAYTQSNYRSPKVNPFTGTLSTNQDIQSKWVQSEGVFNRTAENYSKSLTRNFNSELKDSRNNSVISPSRVIYSNNQITYC